MHWIRGSQYHETTLEGYHVCGTKGADGWRFAAWAPDAYPDIRWQDWPPPELGGREHYAIGQHVPQRCACLGIYQTAAEARTVCETHKETA
jgi:hypothetical protein